MDGGTAISVNVVQHSPVFARLQKTTTLQLIPFSVLCVFLKVLAK